MTVVLNSQQQVLFDTLVSLDWEQVLRVEGPGGTGKTFTVAKALEALVAKQPELRICVAAATHQAVATIKGKMPLQLQSKLTFRTVASLLSKAMFSPEVGVRVSTRGGIRRASGFDLIVLDESSMVSRHDSELLLLSKTQIVEMGDFAQLPPVMAKANVFGSTLGLKTIKLTEQMRNGGAIYKVASLCRDTIHYPAVSSGNITVHASQSSLEKAFFAKLTKGATPEEAVFLAFTNKRVSEMAARVHKHLYGKAHFAPGQWLRMEENRPLQTKGHNVVVKEVGEAIEVEGIQGYKVLVANPSSGAEEWLPLMSPGQGPKLEATKASILAQIKSCKDETTVAFLASTYQQLESVFVPVSSPFVLTIHKSQGVTVPHVYVDTVDVKKGRGGMKRNLLYVAYSRASVHLNTVAVEDVKKTYREVRKQLGFGKVHKVLHKGLWDQGLSTTHPDYAAKYLEAWYEG